MMIPRSPPSAINTQIIIDYRLMATQDTNCFTNTFQWAERFGVASFFTDFLRVPTGESHRKQRKGERVANLS